MFRLDLHEEKHEKSDVSSHTKKTDLDNSLRSKNLRTECSVVCLYPQARVFQVLPETSKHQMLNIELGIMCASV
jgi:hypothetical protein